MIMYLLDKQQNIIKAISDGILEAKMTEEINAADKLVFSLVQNMRLPEEIYYVCIPATRGNAFLMFKIISETVNDDRIEYTCIESAYDELKSYTYLKDVRPQDKTAGEMLNIALAGTRWEAGHVEETPRNQTNFYYISTLEALQKIVELFKVELTFSIVIDPIRNRIVRRQVNLYKQQGERTGKRFEYGSNLLSVTREESSENLVTALVGRGKGEQVSEGQDGSPDGYGRRIMFTDVVWSKANGNPTDKPAGQEYVEDKDATALYGFDDGKPRIGIVTFEDIDDVNKLISATWSALQEAKRPKVSFKASALDVGDLGLGDTVAIIRHELGIEYFTRVYKVEHDLLDKNNNVIELGDDFSERSLTSYVSSIKAAQEETTQIANVALTSANGKNKNFYSTTKPAVAAEGDNLFLDLGNGETEHYVWHFGNWELISSTAELDVVKKQVNEQQKGLEEARAAADSVIAKSNSAYEQAVKGLEEAKKNADAVTGLKTNVKEAIDTANNVSKNYSSLREELLNSDKNNYDALLAEVNKTKQPIAELKTGLEGVNGKYASLDGRVGQFSAGLNGLTAQFNTSKEQLAQLKLDAQGLQAGLSDTNGNLTKLQAKANSIEQQMLGKVGNDLFESFKSSTARELKEKLTATDLNGYVKTTELERTASGIHASVTAVEGKIDGLTIGGTNLLKNTTTEQQDVDAPTNDWINGRVFTTVRPLTEKQYILSFEARSDNDAQRIGTFLWHGGLGGVNVNQKSTNSNGEVFTNSDGLTFVTLNTQWKRYCVLYDIKPDNTRKEIIVGRRWSDSNPQGKIYVRKVKLETGNKATDWSPAPEDIDNEFATVNNTLKANKVTLDVLQNGISLNAAETTKLNDKILNLGIQNLVYNSEFINNAEGWSNIGDNPAGTILFANNEWDSWKGSNGLAFRNPSKQDYLVSDNKRFKVVSGQRLSASVQLHVTDLITHGQCRAGMEIKFYANERDPEIVTSNQQTQFMYNIENGQQKLLYCENVEVPNNANYAAIRLYTFGVGNIIFNQPMCTFSEGKLPYIKDNQMVGTLQDKYASLNVKVDGINATVANKADKSYVDQEANRIRSLVSSKADTSYVDQRANQINSVVANKADISLVNQKADQWQLALTNLQIGGTNLVPLTNQGTRDLYVENKFGVASYAEKNIYGVRGILVKNTSPAPANGWFVIGKNVDLSKFKPDTDYVISFNLRSDTSIKAHAIVDVRGANAQNTISVGDPGYDLDLKAGKVLRVEKKFHTLANFTDVGQVLYINCIELSRVKNLEVWDFKIEEGNKATPWAPAPEDSTVAITAVKNELNTAINLRVQKNELLSQINLQAGHTLIQSNKIYLDAETVAFSGRAFIPSAAITELNADKITAGTLNAARVNIINLDVRNITGDKTEFVRSFWRSAYGNYVNIDYSGMRVTYGNTTTKFDSSGMTINAVGESIGGIGWQGMKGMPPNYQGLTFWLDGGGDYMAWAARDNGNYNMNPLIKMAWYRNEWRPNNTNLGFNFDDPVTLNDLVYPSGKPSDGMALRFFTTIYNGHSYPTIGSASMKAGIMFGDWDLFFVFNDKVYPLDGMKIPREINSDGTVNKWSSVNY